MKKHIFSCTQEVLYIVALMAWGFCRKALTAFQALSPKYTDTFITGQEDLVKAEKFSTVRRSATQSARMHVRHCKRQLSFAAELAKAQAFHHCRFS